MKRILSLMFVVLIVMSLCSCRTIVSLISDEVTSAVNEKLESDTESQSDVEIQSTDGMITLSVPSSWKNVKGELNEEAIWEACDYSKEQYLIVISESKIDFSDNFDLEQYTSLVKDNYSSLTDMQMTAESDTIINEYPAKYFEVSATVNNIKIQYYITTVETKNYFYQFAGWTLLSKADNNRSVINNVVKTFNENSSSTALTF